MSLRRGKKGQWLATDDYTGFTVYADRLRKDYWGNLTVSPLKRNLQEIASPLNDPMPVPFYRGPAYEVVEAEHFISAPLFVGNTNVNTKPSEIIDVLGLDVGIGEASVGETFVVR